MKKILIILESYQYWGGHNMRNADLLKSIALYKENFFSDVRFVCEIKRIFKRGSYLRHFSYNEKVKSREIDFKRLIDTTKNAVILLPSFGPWDIEAFFNVLINDAYLRRFYKSQDIIWFHGALKWFTPLFKFYDEEKREKIFTELIKKRKIIFTLFSELEQIVLERVFTNWDFSYLTFPVYRLKEKVITYKKHEGSFNCSYLGLFRAEKKPLEMEKIIKLLSKRKNIQFFYQLYPLTLNNIILYYNLHKMNNTILLIKELSREEYEKILANTDIGFLPYNKFVYSVKGSGIFEEYITNNIPAFVPDETWMSYILKKYDLLETIYYSYNKDLEEKFDFVISNYNMIMEKWFYLLRKERKRRDIKEFLKNIILILSDNNKLKKEKNRFIDEVDKLTNRGVIDFLLESLIFYKDSLQMFKRLFSTLIEYGRDNIIKNPKYQIVLKISENFSNKNPNRKIQIFSEEEETLKYFSIRFLFKKNRKKLIEILDNKNFLFTIKSIENIPLINLLSARIYALYWRIFPSKKLKNLNYVKQSIVIFLKNLNNKNKISKLDLEFFVELCNEFISFLLNNRITYEKKFVKWCKNVIYRKNLSKKQKYYLLALCEFYLQNFSIALDLLKKSLPYKDFTKDILIKIYNIASHAKENGNYEKAKNLFFFIVKRKKSLLLNAGAYFHLGEIELTMGNEIKAKRLLKKCVDLNPDHKKAKEYLKQLHNKNV